MYHLRSTLLLFYGSPNSDCYICMSDKNLTPSILAKTDTTSKELAQNLFNSITEIDKNWSSIKIEQSFTAEYTEDGNNIIDINYIVLLYGRQSLVNGYKWVKLKDLKTIGLNDEEIKILIEAVSRRF